MVLATASQTVSAGPVTFGNALPLALIAGPCQLESRAHALEVASALKEIAQRLNIGLVYKTSFDKANRTSATGARGIGLEKALPVFAEIRDSLGLPVLTDVHDAAQCAEVAQTVAADPIVAGFLASSQNGTPMPSIPEMGDVWEHWNTAQAAIISGAAAPADAWDKMLADLAATFAG